MRLFLPPAGAPLRCRSACLTVEEGVFMSTARWVNVILGGWLLLSAFWWQDNPIQSFNMGLLGLIIVGLALLARAVVFEIVTALVTLWLFCSPFVLPDPGPWTVWNDCLLGFFAFGTPLSPSRSRFQLPADW